MPNSLADWIEDERTWR